MNQADKKVHIDMEHTIHNYLIRHVDKLLENLRTSTHKELKPEALALFWPKYPVRADDGSVIQRLIHMNITPEMLKTLQKTLNSAAARVDAYAVLFVQAEHSQIKAILESPYGTETWTMQQQRHGDVFVLTSPMHVSNTDVLGALKGG